MKKNVRAIKRRNENIPAIVRDAVGDYLACAHVRQLGKKTQAEYRQELEQFAGWCEQHTIRQDRDTRLWIAADGVTVLDDITDNTIQCYLEHIRATLKPSKPGASEISTYTQAGHVRVIKTFLNWCVLDEQYGPHVGYVTVQRIKKPKVTQTIIETFTDAQIQAMFAACAQEESEHLAMRDRAILAVLLDAGLRAEELVTLKMGDISLRREDAYVRVLGKGDKWGEVGLGEQARGYVQKYIRIFREPTIEYKFKDQHLPARKLQEAIADELVFVNRAGKPLTASGLHRMVVRIGQWAGVKGVRCSPHTMRHSFAVRFWRRTHDIRTLSKLLRHSSIGVTENYLKSIQQSKARIGAPSVLDEL